MIRFFDTSALVKRYVEEPGSAMVRAALRANTVAVARVTLAEAAAAVARAARLSAITVAQRDAILSRLPLDFARLQVIEIRPALVSRVPSGTIYLTHQGRFRGVVYGGAGCQSSGGGQGLAATVFHRAALDFVSASCG